MTFQKLKNLKERNLKQTLAKELNPILNLY